MNNTGCLTYFLVILLVAAALLFVGCSNDKDIPLGNSSETPSASEPSSEPESSEVQASEAPSAESSEAEHSSEAISEEPSEEESSETEVPTQIGERLESYKSVIDTGVYTLTVTELTHIGGESVPRTVCVTYGKDAVHVSVTESNGAVSNMLIKDGAVYMTDGFLRKIYVTEYNEETDRPLSLYDGNITLVKESTVKLYGNTYNCETYEQSDGTRFELLFAGDVLERKRVYDDKLKDYTVTNVSISADTDTTLFELPDYEIEDYR